MQVFRSGHLGKSLAAGLLLALWGCGSSRGTSALDVVPEAPVVQVGERLPLQVLTTEEVAGEPEWEVVETYGGGLLQSRGLQVTYLAPASAGIYHLRLRAPKAGGGTLKQDLAVLVRPSLKLEGATVVPGGSHTFVVRQKGLPRGTFTWSVEEAEGGSIGSDGSYRAPAASGTYHVTATSTELKDVAITAAVTVR